MDRWLQREHGGHSRTFNFLFLTLLLLVSGQAFGMPAYPGPVMEQQPDGSKIELRIRGDEHYNWMEDAAGYTVINNAGWFEYAELDASGNLVTTSLRVGQADPAAAGLSSRILPSASVRQQSMLSMPAGAASGGPDMVPPNGTVKNLVILVRFSNHTGRTQPSEANIDVLMNAASPDPTYAPTGSVKAVYLENSYGQMTLESTVTNWTTVSNSEQYYANGASGDSTLWEALREALDDADAYIDFADFDTDNDGLIDSITFLHSGYGAEWGGNDSFGTNYVNRIWSHRWSIQPSWQSSDQNANFQNVRVGAYHISPAVWGTSGNDIGRIGVIAHETGHFFGLPDLYDNSGEAGSGIGSWGLMANSWDFNFTQQCPPHFSPWSKTQLGWYSPTVISTPGIYSINQAETNAEAYRIDSGFPANEYLLIENRQNAGFDCTIPQGGLVIWHIDDDAAYSTQGYPGQTGWPGNGNHYRIAVLAADGNYDLERNNNRGDAGDVHHASGIDAIGPGPVLHPNTDTYQGGVVTQTGHDITGISASGANMTFCLNGCSGLIAPSSLSAIAAGSFDINLSWTDNSPDEDGFNIERSLNGTVFTPLASVGPNVTGYGDSSLSSGTTYYYRVQAYDATTTSTWSNTANATTNDVPPGTPTSVSATAIDETQIDLAWTFNPGNQDGFRIERAFTNVDEDFSTVNSVGAGVTNYSDTGLSPSTTYHYRVYAFNTAGDSAGYAYDNATTDDPPLFSYYLAYADQFGSGLVTGTYEDTHTGNGVNQSIEEKVSGGKKKDRTTFMGHTWRFNITAGIATSVFANAYQTASSDGDNFDFTWSDDNSNFDDPGHELFTVSSLLGSNTETGTIPSSVSGEVWIRVIDSDRTAGNSRSRETLFVDQLYIEVMNDGAQPPPTAPDGLQIDSVGFNNIDIIWNDNSNNEDNFRVEGSDTGGEGTWSEIASLPANSTSYSETGLANGTTRFYRVRAWNSSIAGGFSVYTGPVSATTNTPQLPPSAPTGLSVTGFTHNSVSLAWLHDLADTTEDGFRVERSDDGVNFSIIGVAGGPNTLSYVDNTVAELTTYHYRVHAYNDTNSPPSNPVSVTTLEDPDPPTLTLTASGFKVKGKKNFNLNWTPFDNVGTVNIIFDGNNVGTAPDVGSHTHSTNLKGGGSHTMQVCPTEGGACSNTETIVF